VHLTLTYVGYQISLKSDKHFVDWDVWAFPLCRLEELPNNYGNIVWLSASK